MKYKNFFIIIHITLLTFSGFGQVNTNTLDHIASQLVTVGNINAQGEVFSTYNTSVAAIGCEGNYCNIYANPDAMSSKSLNTWAFIMGHELGHYALGHTGCGKGGKQAEMDADVYGAELATRAGYNLSSYINALQREPNTCSKSHGCWSERAVSYTHLTLPTICSV